MAFFENIGQERKRIVSTFSAGATLCLKMRGAEHPFSARHAGGHMKRRDFLKTTLAAGGALFAASAPHLSHALAGENTRENHMNVLVLTGSPRKNGNSNTLAAHFIRGAEEAGHKVTRFEAAFHNVHPCTGCNSCGMNGPCVFQDDFSLVRGPLLQADAVAFVTPMYYFGMSAQLKTVIDRFYSVSSLLHTPRKAVLLMTYANNSARNESPILTHYEVLLEYLGWTDAGRVIAPGMWPVGAVEHSRFPEQAYALGKSL